jgi:hypothetical protein
MAAWAGAAKAAANISARPVLNRISNLLRYPDLPGLARGGVSRPPAPAEYLRANEVLAIAI